MLVTTRATPPFFGSQLRCTLREGAHQQNAPSAKRAIFTLSQHSSAYSTAITMGSANFDIDSRVEEAAQYLRNNPKAKQRAVAKKFNVPRDRVRRHLSGVQPKKGRHASNAWLTEPEEVALCRYIDRLDRMNPSVRKEFIKDAADLILRERTEAATPPSVGLLCADLARFGDQHPKKEGAAKLRPERVGAWHEYQRKISWPNLVYWNPAGAAIQQHETAWTILVPQVCVMYFTPSRHNTDHVTTCEVLHNQEAFPGEH